ncbi:uncharacterized protein TM35_000182790 [Trypanosoma theileri]|uniref:Uncharacterized protein n=1 Tax=Trypanosoma theileri TaxID=67003 RepID=A0A1X0NU63_9TRYP|nr:uncharacterized protein TM35_000182790 [Trypanosoma theileri]ORC88222.1 hypothetical protein TM35_000182790 [Trypanosoma theileri]
MSNDAEKQKEKENISLSRLHWLIQRSKIDYKGNPPPFETPKTQKSVEFAKKRASNERVGDADFLPFWHGTSSLAEEARSAKHLRGVDNHRFQDRIDTRKLNYYHQRLDKSTGIPEIVTALCWDLKIDDPNATKASQSKRSDPQTVRALEKKRNKKGISNPYLATLSRAERAVIYREDILSHPKFTKESREFWEGDAWYRGTQLVGPLHIETAKKTSVPSTRNCIRMKGSGCN